MAEKRYRQEEIAGDDLVFYEHPGWDFNTFKWEQQYLCTTYEKDSNFELKPEYSIDKAGYTDIVGVFPTLDKAFESVAKYLKEHEDLQEMLRKWHEEAKEDARRRRENSRAEKAKFYHIELKDLTAEHNLYYTDLISTRLRNCINAAEVYTLADICHWKRNDFKRIRNCGEKATAELDNLLQQVGLSWDTPLPQSEDEKDFPSFDEGFKKGYDTAVLKAKEWLKVHPDAFTRPDGEENFLKAMEEER